jgi:hypothetical protein
MRDRPRLYGPAALSAAGLLLIALAPLVAVPAVRSAESRRVASAVVVDGRADEWTPDSLVRDDKSGTTFGFQNDGQNIYVLLVIDNGETLASADATGITILSRPAGSKKRVGGVYFMTRSISADGYIDWLESQGALLTESEKAEIRKIPRHDAFASFAITAQGSTYGPLRRQAGHEIPDFRVSQGPEGTIFEFRIPLASAKLVPGGIGAEPGRDVRLFFEWGGKQAWSLLANNPRNQPGYSTGFVSGAGLTWAQEFLDQFDAMNRPNQGTRRYDFDIDVKLASAK